jgi:hypothetical protein
VSVIGNVPTATFKRTNNVTRFTFVSNASIDLESEFIISSSLNSYKVPLHLNLINSEVAAGSFDVVSSLLLHAVTFKKRNVKILSLKNVIIIVCLGYCKSKYYDTLYHLYENYIFDSN